MFDLYFASVLVFFALIAIWLYKDRKNVEVKAFVLFMRRTKKFRSTIDNIAKKSPKFWKIISTIAIFVCFYYMFQGMYLILGNSYQIFLGNISEPGLKLILPSASSTGANGPGYILIPFWFWIITIACILIPHELSHGIIARAEKIRLKSVGLMLLAVLPGAFVEPDEKQLKKSKLITRLRVFTAGSGANLLVAGLVFASVTFLLWPGITDPGIELIYVNETSPASLAGLQENTILTQVNGHTITTTYQEYMGGKGYLIDEIQNVSVGDTLTFTTEQGTHDVTVGSLNGVPFIGIIYAPVYKFNSHFLQTTIIPLLTMIWLFSFAVAIFNILPLYPLDGGLMVEALAEKVSKKKYKLITKTISIAVLLIILYNFFGPSLM